MIGMEARLRTTRISPQKMRRIARPVIGMRIADAENYLRFLPTKPAKILLKLLHSAAQNAEHNFEQSKEGLIVKNVVVDEGIALRRMLPRARGRADVLRKRTSHIGVFLSDGAGDRKIAGKKSDIETRKVEELSHDELRDDREKDAAREERGAGAPSKSTSRTSDRKQGTSSAVGAAAALQKRGGTE